ncbi:M20/M25/M40 family metallo-hydrolase [Sulfobacillus harzensis]|uniref:M20 family metallopeptidase n=1 Tax=Sulfobacillus harzensis TaxID=2729629 RepID=A0A7Y0L2J8_9FIRM|nr:M20/M25/M40 family metallo-hydrolase [Sulfobacillus harzensis]NMP22133.1 M20 family metallopeptidase [Sulfobacillus harzensis]
MAHPSASSAMRQWLQELVMIESPSGDAKGVQDVMERIAEVLDGTGRIRWETTPMGPILQISRGSGGALLLGHADTVWPQGTLKDMPWRDEGEWVYGPGALDMKAGLALAMAVIRDLPETVPFRLLVTPDEEVGSEASRTAIEEAAQLAPLVLVLESGMPGGAIKVGRAGVGDFRLYVRGIESHAGLDPDRGASAIRELAHQILWLEGLEQKVLGTTVNVGVVSGGTRSNVVAGKAEAHIDVRVTTRTEMDRIRATLEAPPRFDPNCQVEYQGGINRPPMEPTADSAVWVERARRIWSSVAGQQLAGVRVGGASDGNFTARFTPTLDGLGAVGIGAHARGEGVEWRWMEPRHALLTQLISEAGRKA